MKRLYVGILAAVFATIALADTFSLFSPSSGIMVGDPNTYVTTSATSSDVTSLWAGTCDATTYLRGDGSCAGVATGAAGSDGQVQFNSSGAFGASSGLTWNSGTSTLTATNIAGSGAAITALNASNLASGTVADARLSSNVALKNAANVFTQTQRIAYTGGQEQLRLNHDNALLTFYNAANSARSGYLWMRSANPSQLWVEANQDLQIGTNNTTRMAIAAAGNVSINSPSSGYPLYVEGDVRTHLPSGSNSTFRGYDFGIVGDGTSYGNIGMNMTSGEMRHRAGFNGWGGYHTFYTDGSERVVIGAAGNVAINAPSSGASLSIASSFNQIALQMSDGTITGFLQPYGTGAEFAYGTTSNHPLTFYSNATHRGTISAAGNWTINAPSSGNSLTVAGIDGNTGIRYNSNSVGVALGYVSGTTAFLGTVTAHQMNLLAGNASRITISSTGNVTVNAPLSGIGLTVNSSASATALSVGTTAIGSTGEIRATGDITAFYSSDARLKENVAPISDALAKIERIRGVEFDWTQDYIDKRGGEDGYFIRRHDVGVIAQEVQAVLPEVVGKREDGTLAVKYDRLVPLLIESIRELKAANDELYARLEVLEAGR